MIERLLAGARVGESGVLVLTGEAGIGKTALLAETVTLATGMRVLRAGGTVTERDVPFGGLLQVLRPVLDGLDRLPGPQSSALAAALALRADAGDRPREDRFAVGAATLGLLAASAEDEPLAVVVDDVHLLDEPSGEALAFAARRLVTDRVAFVAAARPEAGPVTSAGLPELRVGGLDLETARILVSARTPHSASSELASRLHRTTGGNPLALIELAEHVDTLEPQGPEAPLPVPAVVAGAFSARTLQLATPVRTALLVAAVAGEDLSLVAAACSLLDVRVDVLADAEAAGLVDLAVGRVEFRHPLVASSLYSDATAAQRRRVHRAVADALPPSDDDRRAWHQAAAALGPDEAVAVELARVGTGAGDRRAHAVAATAFERAARLSPAVDARVTRLCGAAESAWFAGQGERAGALAVEALAASPGPSMVTRLQAVRGAVAAHGGALEEAHQVLVAGADVVGQQDADGAVGLLADAVIADFYLGDARAALDAVTRIEALLERPVTARTRVLGTLAAGMARVLAGQGGTTQVRESVEALAASPDLQRDPRLSTWLVLGPLWLRESGSGRELVARAVQDVRERVALGSLPFMLFLVARDDATTDRWSDAEAGYSEGIRLARETGHTSDLVAGLAGLGWLVGRQGRAPAAEELLDEATALARRHHIHVFDAWARFARGELALAVGQPARAVVHLSGLEEQLTDRGLVDVDLVPGPELTEALLRVGRTEDAARAAERYAEQARAKGQPWALARAERAAGLVAPDDALDVHFAAAMDLHAHSLEVFETARTQLAYGSRLRRARRRVDARPVLREAVETFDRLGAVPWADLAAVELRATGATARRREPGTADTLTAQERQISRMLAGGMTTREAAAALFLSPKTVEYHLRHVYTKLGVSSRTDLAGALDAGQ